MNWFKFSFGTLILIVTIIAIVIRLNQTIGYHGYESAPVNWLNLVVGTTILMYTGLEISHLIMIRPNLSECYKIGFRACGILLFCLGHSSPPVFEDAYGFEIEIVSLKYLYACPYSLGLLFCLMPLGSNTRPNRRQLLLMRVAILLMVGVLFCPVLIWVITADPLSLRIAAWYNWHTLIFAAFAGGILFWLANGILGGRVYSRTENTVPALAQIAALFLFLTQFPRPNGIVHMIRYPSRDEFTYAMDAGHFSDLHVLYVGKTLGCLLALGIVWTIVTHQRVLKFVFSMNCIRTIVAFCAFALLWNANRGWTTFFILEWNSDVLHLLCDASVQTLAVIALIGCCFSNPTETLKRIVRYLNSQKHKHRRRAIVAICVVTLFGMINTSIWFSLLENNGTKNVRQETHERWSSILSLISRRKPYRLNEPPKVQLSYSEDDVTEIRYE